VSTTRRAWIAWVAVCVIWGTTYLGIKVALESIPPFLMGGLRYLLAGVLLALVLVARGRSLPPLADWGRMAVLGFFMVSLGNGGVVYGEQYVPSGLTAVIIGTSPFWMVSVNALVTGGKQIFLRQWIGLLIGFAGIVLLVWPDITAGGASGSQFAFGVIAVQIACAGWAVGSAYTRRHVMPRNVMGSAALQMFFGGVFMTIAGTLLGEWDRLAFTGRTTAAFFYLVVVGAVIAFAAYSYALRHLDIAIVSLYTYVNPVIAVALGTLLLGEPFGLRMLVAAAIIVLGVAIVGPTSKTGTTGTTEMTGTTGTMGRR
jgi:drug/metabolite transporter (DMT)-like permease